MKIKISDRTRKFEIISVIVTGLGKILFVDILDLKFYFILMTILFWGCYFAFKVSRHKELMHYWGLSFLNIKENFRIVGFTGIFVFCLLLFYGLYNNTIKLSWNILFVLLAYPVWGLVQQFLTMSLFAGNLKDYKRIHFNYYFIVVATSLLFSIVHYPSFSLIIATFLMAIFYSILFLRVRNIIPLGLFHGILGVFFYYLILNRDPWAEFIKNLK